MDPNKPAKTWDVVVNNYTDEDIAMFQSWENDVTRMTISKEVGEGGTPHLQGRITFKRTYRFAALKKIHGTANWSDTKCAQDAIYQKKQGSELIINVDNRRQGKRADLEDAIEAIKEGTTKRAWMMQFPSVAVKYRRMYDDLNPVYHPTEVVSEFTLMRWKSLDQINHEEGPIKSSIVLWGKSGIGKTEYAKQQFDMPPLFVRHMDDLGKFDPEIHGGILFDDMSFTQMPRTAQIHLLDADNDSSIHIRYGVAKIPAHTFKIFTSNTKYIFNQEDEAIDRRVQYIELKEEDMLPYDPETETEVGER